MCVLCGENVFMFVYIAYGEYSVRLSLSLSTSLRGRTSAHCVMGYRIDPS